MKSGKQDTPQNSDEQCKQVADEALKEADTRQTKGKGARWAGEKDTPSLTKQPLEVQVEQKCNKSEIEDFKVVIQNMHKLPDDLRKAFLECPVIRYAPIDSFLCSLSNGAYEPETRDFARLLYNNNPKDRLIELMVTHDLGNLRRIPGINAYTAKSYMYNKYKLSNKETMRITGFKTMQDALQIKHQLIEALEDGSLFRRTPETAPIPLF